MTGSHRDQCPVYFCTFLASFSEIFSFIFHFLEEFSYEIFSGDAFSPLLIGIIAEKLQSGRPESYYAEFTSLQYGMLLCPLLSALGMDQKVLN